MSSSLIDKNSFLVIIIISPFENWRSIMNKGWILLLKAITWLKQSYKRRTYTSLTAFAVAVLIFMYLRP